MGHVVQPVGEATQWRGSVMAPRDGGLGTAPESKAHGANGHGGDSHADQACRRASVLARVIEREIVPRLLLAHRTAPAVPTGPMTDVEAVARLTRLVLEQDMAGARSCVEQFLDRGAGFDRLCHDLLAPAVLRLREMGRADSCDATAVTIGLWRVEQILHEWAPAFRQIERGEAGRRALIAALPSEQHSFEVQMATEFFRCDGWTVRSRKVTSRRDLVDLVGQDWFAVASLWFGLETRLDPLATTIRAVRRASRNRALGVLVDGTAFDDRPELVRLVGADAMTQRGQQAPLQAKRLVSLLAARG